jgi:hypothetical protein
MRWSLACALFFGCAADQPAVYNGPDMALPKCDDTNAGVCPAQVHGQVVDENSQPVTALTVSVCADQCFFGMTGGDGKFTVVPDQHILLDNYALELHGRPDHVTYYTPLAPANGLQIDFTQPLLLPTLPVSGPELAAGGTFTSGDVSVTVPAGTMIIFDVEDFGVANGHQLRVLAISAALAGQLPFVGTPKPDALYACSPFEVSFSQKASLSIANPGLPAGAAVEIQQLRGLVNDGLPAGHWMHAASAHVSADGKSVTTDPGEGVTELTWLWLKKM